MIVAAALVSGGGYAVFPAAAMGETKTYEFLGEWVDAPATAVSGETALASKWYFDINDPANAPENAPVPNNVLNLNLENAVFSDLPQPCLTTEQDAAGNSVNPVSTVSADGHSVTCNLGTRVQGTAEMSVAGILAVGPEGSKVRMSGTFGGHEVTLPEIPIQNTFTMNARFSGGVPISGASGINFTDFVSFPFELLRGAASPAGPESVAIDISLSFQSTNSFDQPGPYQLRTDIPACGPNSRIQPGYPFSDGAHPAEQSVRSPDCTLESTGDNTFRLTLNHLDYSDGDPQFDSNGQPLDPSQRVIAAGSLNFLFYLGNSAGTTTLTATEPEYHSVDGRTAVGDPKDNTNKMPSVHGVHTGGWVVGAQRPQGYPGSPWTNTSLVPVGVTVMSTSAVDAATHYGDDNWVCQIIDTKYVDFQEARVSVDPKTATELYYDRSNALPIWYYTGDLVNPGSNTVVDPNDFECGGKVDPKNPAAGNQSGWSLTPPADPSTVKAVKVRVPYGFGSVQPVTAPNNSVWLTVDQRIHDDVSIGQDIWTWTTTLQNGLDDWAFDDTGRVVNARTDDPDDLRRGTGPGVPTPGLRYAYAATKRDVLRTVGSEPTVQLDVAKSEYLPNAQADYHVDYGLQSNMAQPAPDQVEVVVVLPPGVTYVAGSAPSEPTVLQPNSPAPSTLANSLGITTIPDGGQQWLSWTFDNVQPNQKQGFDLKGTVPQDSAGKRLSATALALSQGILRQDDAEFVVPVVGRTSLAVNAAQDTIDLKDVTGAATPTFTVDLVSADSNTSNVTDVIDVLPYVGDKRGTAFTGELSLAQVTPPTGAKVYYTTADPDTLDEDPGAAVNGGFGAPSAMWSQTFTAQATAIRIVAGELAPGATQRTVIALSLQDARAGDRLDNLAVGRAESTALRMRSSAGIGFVNTATPPETPPVPPVLPPVPPVIPPAPPVIPPVPPVIPPATTPPATPPASTPPVTTPPATPPVTTPPATTPPATPPATIPPATTPPATTPPTAPPSEPNSLARTGSEPTVPLMFAVFMLLVGATASILRLRRRREI